MGQGCVKAALIAAVIFFVAGIGAGQEKGKEKTGAEEFQAHCVLCHLNGGNVIEPDKPLKGSKKLATFKTFLTWIRKPVEPMPPVSPSVISDQQARELYNYLTSGAGPGR